MFCCSMFCCLARWHLLWVRLLHAAMIGRGATGVARFGLPPWWLQDAIKFAARSREGPSVDLVGLVLLQIAKTLLTLPLFIVSICRRAQWRSRCSRNMYFWARGKGHVFVARCYDRCQHFHLNFLGKVLSPFRSSWHTIFWIIDDGVLRRAKWRRWASQGVAARGTATTSFWYRIAKWRWNAGLAQEVHLLVLALRQRRILLHGHKIKVNVKGTPLWLCRTAKSVSIFGSVLIPARIVRCLKSSQR